MRYSVDSSSQCRKHGVAVYITSSLNVTIISCNLSNIDVFFTVTKFISLFPIENHQIKSGMTSIWLIF